MKMEFAMKELPQTYLPGGECEYFSFSKLVHSSWGSGLDTPIQQASKNNAIELEDCVHHKMIIAATDHNYQYVMTAGPCSLDKRQSDYGAMKSRSVVHR